ncbi:MAG: cobalamin-binding protein [Gammaproteobacteria bacterium]
MKKLVVAVGLATCIFAYAHPAAAAVVLKDDLGNRIVLATPAKRIVSLAPSVTEIVYAAGAGNRLVGVSAWSDYPPAAKKLPQVGDAFRVDLERISALRPDLVIAAASATPPAAREALARLGLPILLLAPRKLEDIAREMRLVGRAAGTSQTADHAAADFLTERERLAQIYAGVRGISVFYEISAQPLYTIGGEQIISQVLALCGGRNVFAELNSLAPVVDEGAVLARNPQAILTGNDAGAQARLDAWRRWPWLTAVKSDNLFVVPSDLLARPGPRILAGAADVCRDLATARRRLDR